MACAGCCYWSRVAYVQAAATGQESLVCRHAVPKVRLLFEDNTTINETQSQCFQCLHWYFEHNNGFGRDL